MQHGKDSFCLPRQYLPQSDGGVFDEGYRRAGGALGQFYIASAATSTEEIGNGVYPPVRRLLTARGIDCSGKTARQLTRADYDGFDLLVGMDKANVRNMRRICLGDGEGKIRMLLSFAGREDEVADPWYTRDFNAAERDIDEGCRALLEFVRERL